MSWPPAARRSPPGPCRTRARRPRPALDSQRRAASRVATRSAAQPTAARTMTSAHHRKPVRQRPGQCNADRASWGVGALRMSADELGQHRRAEEKHDGRAGLGPPATPAGPHQQGPGAVEASEGDGHCANAEPSGQQRCQRMPHRPGGVGGLRPNAVGGQGHEGEYRKGEECQSAEGAPAASRGLFLLGLQGAPPRSNVLPGQARPFRV